MQERMAHALDMPEQEIKTDDENDNCSKCDNLDRLVDLIQAKIAVSLQKKKKLNWLLHWKVGQLKKLLQNFM